MMDAAQPIVSQGKLTPDQLDALQRLPASQTFSTAPRLRAVLTYLIRGLEHGTVDQISEQSIGQEVFGKPAGYNASEDNIVRVTLRHLRTRLEEYYQSEGREDLWMLTIPKGKYIPILIAQERATPSEARNVVFEPPTLPVDVPAPLTDRTLAPQQVVQNTSFITWVWMAGLLSALCMGYILRYWQGHSANGSGGVVSQLVRPGEDVSVVVVDSNLEAYRQIFHRQVVLDEYIRRGYAHDDLGSNDPRLIDAQHFASGTNETNVSSTVVAAEVQQALEGRHVTIKHPHDASIRDFQNQKLVVLLGGPFINPWGQLFEKRMNFRMLPVPDAPASSQVHNQSPAPGELSDYIPRSNGTTNVNYVRIAILPNFNNSGHVITVGATSGESLEEAGSYLLSDEAGDDLKRIFHTSSISSLPPLELLLEVGGLNAVPNSHHILSYRIVPPNG